MYDRVLFEKNKGKVIAIYQIKYISRPTQIFFQDSVSETPQNAQVLFGKIIKKKTNHQIEHFPKPT